MSAIHNSNRKLTNPLKQLAIVITTTLLCLNIKHTSSFTTSIRHQKTNHHPFISHHLPLTTTTLHLSSPNDSDEPPQLITSATDLESTLENLKSQYPTSEQDYLSASKKRAEEGRRKLLEEEAREQERAAQREREREQGLTRTTDYGPGDLSSFTGFDDGFEASAGNDDTVASLWSSGGGGEEEEGGGGEGGEEEEPKLLLFDDGGDNPDLLL